MISWKEYLGKRVLIRQKLLAIVREARIIDVSPSGLYMKLSYNDDSRDIWEEAADYDLIEVLGGAI